MFYGAFLMAKKKKKLDFLDSQADDKGFTILKNMTIYLPCKEYSSVRKVVLVEGQKIDSSQFSDNEIQKIIKAQRK